MPNYHTGDRVRRTELTCRNPGESEFLSGLHRRFLTGNVIVDNGSVIIGYEESNGNTSFFNEHWITDGYLVIDSIGEINAGDTTRIINSPNTPHLGGRILTGRVDAYRIFYTTSDNHTDWFHADFIHDNQIAIVRTGTVNAQIIRFSPEFNNLSPEVQGVLRVFDGAVVTHRDSHQIQCRRRDGRLDHFSIGWIGHGLIIEENQETFGNSVNPNLSETMILRTEDPELLFLNGLRFTGRIENHHVYYYRQNGAIDWFSEHYINAGRIRIERNGGENMPQAGDKTKSIGVHKLKIKKYLADDGEQLICEIAVNETLQELVKHYAVTSQAKVSEKTEVYGNKLHRYKVKNALRNSVNWQDVFYILFTEDIIKRQAITLKMSNARSYSDFINQLSVMRDLIRIMEELKQEETVNVDIDVRRTEE